MWWNFPGISTVLFPSAWTYFFLVPYSLPPCPHLGLCVQSLQTCSLAQKWREEPCLAPPFHTPPMQRSNRAHPFGSLLLTSKVQTWSSAHAQWFNLQPLKKVFYFLRIPQLHFASYSIYILLIWMMLLSRSFSIWGRIQLHSWGLRNLINSGILAELGFECTPFWSVPLSQPCTLFFPFFFPSWFSYCMCPNLHIHPLQCFVTALFTSLAHFQPGVSPNPPPLCLIFSLHSGVFS